ncbi:hypothetical protein BDM02DRAFT_3263686 [Thelephora ganbajun]|uniref:Uncharacterized protein n=1 Tax=Thelephora ganbajun TaxID=370292 RepID=A0ACB6Z3R8_THEGA|nr:hypothetical protein BDM02DRAFT_3263686 [Thelephora ganbajun]
MEDPLRPGVREAIAACHHAGVTVKMCIGDNVLTARPIVAQCGIYTAGGIVMEGPTFCDLTPHERLETIPVPKSWPVSPATVQTLKTANTGSSMGITGTEVTKGASNIILMDDNFVSIVEAVVWDICVNNAVYTFTTLALATDPASGSLLDRKPDTGLIFC